MPDKRELLDELKSVLAGQSALLDSILPPLIFLLANVLFDFQAAMAASLAVGAGIAVMRLIRGHKIWYALGGLGAAGLAIGLRYLFNSEAALFLPTLISGGLTTLALLVSLLIKRPAVAFTSALTRRWPLAWYWHPKVRPAYAEVTAFWVIFSSFKLAGQLILYSRGDAAGLALFNLVSGWPALIILLIISYLYGLRRLKNLQGPSVEEFETGQAPPWQGQQRGF